MNISIFLMVHEKAVVLKDIKSLLFWKVFSDGIQKRRKRSRLCCQIILKSGFLKHDRLLWKINPELSSFHKRIQNNTDIVGKFLCSKIFYEYQTKSIFTNCSIIE